MIILNKQNILTLMSINILSDQSTRNFENDKTTNEGLTEFAIRITLVVIPKTANS